jgi:hypothetical protein
MQYLSIEQKSHLSSAQHNLFNTREKKKKKKERKEHKVHIRLGVATTANDLIIFPQQQQGTFK